MSALQGWELLKLRDIASLKTGPFGSALHKADYIVGGVPLINPTHIKGGRLVPSADVSVPHAIAARLAEYRLNEGDIVMGRRGEMGRCAVVPRHAQDWICGTGSVVVKCSPAALPAYLQKFLTAPATVAALIGDSVGSTMINLNQGVLLGLDVPLAPLPEQKRIADKLDTVLARVDGCRDRLDRLPALLKRFRQSILAAATSGRLTEDWRGESEKDWRQVRLNEIGVFGRGKSKHRPRNDPRLYGGPYPFVQTGDVTKSNGIIQSHSQTYSDFGLSQSKLWPAGTLCITIAANIADTAILSYPACFPDSIVGFEPDQAKCRALFVKWTIDVIKDDLEHFAPATAQKNINLAACRA